LGNNGGKALLTRIRSQGNTAEYAPIGLLLLLIAELQGAPTSALHVLGVLLLAGRALHALAFASHPVNLLYRVAGMGLTLTMIGVTAIGVTAHSLL